MIDILLTALLLVSAVQVGYSTTPASFSDNFNDQDYGGWLATDVANSKGENSYLRNFWLSRDDSQWEIASDNQLEMHWRTVGKGYGATNRGSWLWFGTEDNLRAQYYWDQYPGSNRTSVPLGMGAGNIADAQITTPNGLLNNREAKFGRLDSRDHCWSSSATGSPKIEINLGKKAYITAIAMQGAPDLPEWPTVMKFFTKLDGVGWTGQVDTNGVAACQDQNTTWFYEFPEPILADEARFTLTEWNNEPSARVELYGRWVQQPLGMGTEQVLQLPNDALTGSSNFSDTYDARYARLDKDRYWKPLTNDVGEYLQVDLGSLHSVTAVSVQTGYEVTDCITTYDLEYSTDGIAYTNYGTTLNGPDGTTADEKVLTEVVPFDARYVRIVTVTSNGDIALRAEIYGEPAGENDLALGPFVWSDYTVSAALKPYGNGQLGVAFRYLNPYNYYEFRYFHGQKGSTELTSTSGDGINGPVRVSLKGGMNYDGGSSCDLFGYNNKGQCLFDDTTAGPQTKSALNPYIKVDLRGLYSISYITVRNRANNEIDEFYVYMQDTTSTAETIKQCGTVVTLSLSEEETFDCYNQSGHYIFLAASGTTELNIDDLAIFGPDIAPHRDLVKVENGITTVLWTDSYQYVPEDIMDLSITAIDDQITVVQDEVQLLDLDVTSLNLCGSLLDEACTTNLYRGTIAATISQEVGSKFNNFEVVHHTNALTLGAASTGLFIKSGAWRHYECPVAVDTHPVMTISVAASSGYGLHLYAKLDEPADYGIYDFITQEDVLTYTNLFVPDPAIGTYYIGVFAAARDHYQVDFDIICDTPALYTAAEGHDQTYTLSELTQYDFFEVTVATTYTSLSVEFTGTGGPIKVIYKEDSPPTLADNHAEFTVANGATEVHVVPFPVPGVKYYYAVAVDGGTPSYDYNVAVVPPVPSILSLSPEEAGTNSLATLVLNGDDFSAGGSVYVGPFLCTPDTWGPNEVVVNLPEGHGRDLNVRIVTDGLGYVSNNVTFSFTGPAITAMNPSTGPPAGGTEIILSGTNFGIDPKVTIDGQDCTIKAGSTHSQVTFYLPPGTGSNKVVQLTAKGQKSGNKLFTYFAPLISDVEPPTSRTIGGGRLAIKGSHFGNIDVNEVTVEVDGKILSINKYNDSFIECDTEPGEGTGKTVRVEVNGRSTTAGITFSYAPPVINKYRPQTGPTLGDDTPGGFTLTLVGDNFGINPVVTVDTFDCPVDVANTNHTYLECALPKGDGTDKVILLTVGGQSSSAVNNLFDFYPPTMTWVRESLINTDGTSIITIKGTDFGRSGSVTVGELACFPQAVYNHTHILCTAPAGDGPSLDIKLIGGTQESTNTLSIGYKVPNITSVEPQRGYTKGGTTITLTGTQFGPTGSDITVNNIACPVIANGHSQTQVECTLPASQGEDLDVCMTVNTQPSNCKKFSYAPPHISSFFPTSFETKGGASQLITLTGTSFGFSGVVNVSKDFPCVPTSGGWSHTQIVCEVPELTKGDGLNNSITVKVNAQRSNNRFFDYEAPVISAVSPATYSTIGSSAAIKLLTITGTSFSTNGNVTVDGVDCPISAGLAGTSWSHSVIKCALPEGRSSSVLVQVSTAFGRNSGTYPFGYTKPTLTSRSPTELGTLGTQFGDDASGYLTLQGTSFGVEHPNGYVLVGGKNCTQKGVEASWTHTKIVCWMPEGVGSVNAIQVFVADQSSAQLFINYAAPSININASSPYGEVYPHRSRTSGGQVFTINGQNFGTTGAVVTISSYTCIIHSQNHTQIVAETPGGGMTEGNKQLTVKVADLFSNVVTFVIDGPQLNSISPDHGVTGGGDVIQLIGESFGTNPRVTFDDVLVTPVTVIDEFTLEVASPAGFGTGVEVMVATELQTAFSKVRLFNYDAPNITVIDPTDGPTGGAIPITLHGINFGTESLITVGGQTCPSTGGGTNHLTAECTLPAGYGKGIRVEIDVGGQKAWKWFRYRSPVITAITGPGNADPPPMPTAGGTILTITGTDFSSSGSVTVNNVPCPIYAFTYSHTEIQCTLPAGQGVDVPVIVYAPIEATDGSNTESYDAPVITSIEPETGTTQANVTVLTIRGENFGTFASISVGGNPCYRTGIEVTTSRIECYVPEGEGLDKPVIVTRDGLPSNSDYLFDYLPATLDWISPTTCDTIGGCTMKLTGSSFGLTPTVELNNFADTDCVVDYAASNHTYIECSVPPGFGVDLEVSVHTAGPQESGVQLFSYNGPTIEYVEGCTDNYPKTELCAGPIATAIITVYGNNFGPSGAIVKIGGEACDTTDEHVTGNEHTQYYCGLPTGVGLDLEVRVDVGTLSAQANLVSFGGPTVTSAFVKGGGWDASVIPNITILGEGGQRIGVNGTFFGTEPTDLEVKYGPAGITDFTSASLFTCTVVATGFSEEFFWCDTGESMGADMRWYLKKTVVVDADTYGQEYLGVSPNFLATVRAEIVPLTIRKGFGYQGITGADSGSYRGSDGAEGEVIHFNVTNIGSPAQQAALGLITVFYGGDGGLNGVYDQECTNVEVIKEDLSNKEMSVLSCRTSAQPEFKPNRPQYFRVFTGGVPSKPGTDYYQFPIAPEITSVEGCSAGADPDQTYDCPTIGGTLITIHGANFTSSDPNGDPNLSARIGSESCTAPTFIDTETMTCIMPPGAGLGEPVVVVIGNLFSNPKNFVSYAVPTVTKVRGCTPVSGDDTATQECARAGGDTIQIIGTNFGPDVPLVLVGGEQCTFAQVNVLDHTEVNCTVPPGVDKNKAVLVIQSGGDLSQNTGKLSYVQCELGTYDTYLVDANLTCSSCPAGSYTDTTGATECKQCESGYFASGKKNTFCEPCPAGTFSEKSEVDGEFFGPTECTACAIGTFNDATAQAVCKECPAGTSAYDYDTDTDTSRLQCFKCAVGRFTDGQEASVCEECATGRFSATEGSVSCTDCPAGQYQDETAADTCKTCDAGTANPDPAADICPPCNPGQYQNAPGQAACLECDAGTYSNDTNAEKCTKCGVGKFAVKISGLFGATECTECSPGEYINVRGQASCLLCGKGTYSSADGSSECTKCEVGRAASTIGAEECALCSEGFYAGSTGFVECKECGPGTYSGSTESTECEPCEMGRYSAATAATECTPCAEGSAIGFTGQVACAQCESGTYTDLPEQFACLDCASGSYSVKSGASGPTGCINCTSGFYQGAAGQDGCLECPVGTFADGDALTECEDCPVGYATASAASPTCTACNPGYFSLLAGGIVCEKCPAGTYNQGYNNSECIECEAGRYQPNPGQSDCISTVGGEFTDTTRQGTFKSCAAGTFNNDTEMTFCWDCQVGKYQPDPGMTECIDCDSGSYLNSRGQISCLLCPVGRFQKETGKIECDACAPGNISTVAGSTICSPCGVGTFSTGGTSFCTDCPAGQYQDMEGQDGCIPCEPGFVQPVGGLSTCIPCDPGTYIASSGGLICKDCSPGSYASEYNQTACELCPTGRYEGLGGASECLNCTTGTFSISEGSIGCTDCDVGTFAEFEGMTECEPCDPGFYQDQSKQAACLPCAVGDAIDVAGQAACSECPEGFYAEAEESQECQICEPGRFSVKPDVDSGPSFCEGCPAGRYQGAYGQNDCIDCPVGYYQNVTNSTECIPCTYGEANSVAGSETCTECVRGRYAPNLGTITCGLCPVGTKSAVGDDTGARSCDDCEPGFYQDVAGKTTCIQCAAGTYNAAFGQGVCTVCEVGRFSDELGSESCTKCPPGSYQDESNAETCKYCQPGEFTSVAGEAKCSQCDAGTYTDVSNSSSCADCLEGTYSVKRQPGDLGAIECTTCELGRYINTIGQAACLKCDVGRYGPIRELQACTLCPTGTYTDQTGLSECDECAPGSYTDLEGTISCPTCPVGTVQPMGAQTECVVCPNATYQASTGQLTCDACPDGEFNSVERQASCKQCEAGKFTNASTPHDECTDCPEGRFQTQTGQSKCEACPKGTYFSGTGAVTCTPCEKGTFANLTGLETCFECPPGRFQPSEGNDTCIECPLGTANTAPRQKSCIACLPGFFANLTGSLECSACSPGKAQPSSEQAECLPCAPGTAQQSENQKSCDPCGVGEYSTENGTRECVQCPEGKYQPATGSSECLLCAPGKFTDNPGESVCEDCSTGRASNETALNTTCPFCELGSYQLSTGQTGCELCPAGSYSDNPNNEAGECTGCIAGRYQNEEGQSDCIDCPVGSYQPNPNAVECIFCPNGTYSDDVKLKACRDCPAGQFQPEINSTRCYSCRRGTAQDAKGSDECEACEVGRYTNSTEQRTCTACDPGTFTNNTGQKICEECVPGKYQPSILQVECLDCPLGTAQQTPKQAACIQCDTGRFANDTGLINCIKCAAGQYQPSKGQSNCTYCPRGTISQNTGSDKCYDCKVGEYNPDLGAKECLECLPGSFQANTGRNSCELCPVGRYQQNARKGFCTECPVGRFANETNSTDCTDCPAGKYQSSKGEDFCIECPEGMAAEDPGAELCTPCNAGTFTNETGMKTCLNCPNGKYQNLPNKNFCINCTYGQYCDSAPCETCTLCEAGRFANEQGRDYCDQCPLGSTQTVPGSRDCDDCEKGYFTDRLDLEACEACKAGTFANQTRATTCYSCPRGTAAASIGQANCTGCPIGKYSNRQGLEICDDCDAGKFSDEIGTLECTSCDPGKYQSQKAEGSCLECPNGTYTSTSGQTECTSCPVGKFANDTGQSRCYDCQPGLYQDQKGEDHCLSCPTGTFSDVSAKSSCTDCDPGEYQPLEGQQSCQKCVAGKSQVQTGSETCDDCALGKFVASTGQAECTLCPAGQYGNDTKLEACYFCDIGKFNSENGKSTCSLCLAGTSSSATGSRTCGQCDPGTYAPYNGTFGGCLDCPEGKYQGSAGQTACLLCPRGHFSSTTAATACTPCAQGKFASLTGQLACTECGVGKYQDDIGKIECNNCLVGKYNAETGRKVCTDCTTGFYANTTGQLECFDCKPGKYQDLQGQSTCVNCANGTFARSERAKTCDPCDSGFYAPDDGASSCLKCPRGRAQSLPGSDSCDACTAGRSAGDQAQVQCDLCETGRYNSWAEAWNCSACAAGTYQSGLGKTECFDCIKGTSAQFEASETCDSCLTGTFGNETAARKCYDCPAGQYQNNPGSVTCQICVPGKFSAAGSTECTTCGDGTVTAEYATTIAQQTAGSNVTTGGCLPCDSSVSIANGDRDECLCLPGYYLKDYQGGNIFSCWPCEEGMDCRDLGSRDTEALALPGYWRYTNDTSTPLDGQFYRCQKPSQCSGGAVVGGEPSPISGSGCAAHRIGILCSYCEDGYRSAVGATCEACPDSDAGEVLFAVLIAFLFILLVWVQMYVILRSGEDQLKNVQAVSANKQNFLNGDLHDDQDDESYLSFDDSSDDSDSSSSSSSSGSDSSSDDTDSDETTSDDENSAVGDAGLKPEEENLGDDMSGLSVLEKYGPPPPKPNFTYKLKIFVGFLQIVTNISNDLEINWPESFTNFIIMFDVINFDYLLVQVTSSECIQAVQYYEKYLAIVMGPLLVGLLVLCFYTIPKQFDCCCYKFATANARIRSKIRFWRVFLYALFIIYPGVSSTVLAHYVCAKIGDTWYLRADYRIECQDEQWLQYAFGSMALIIIYPIGIPVFFFILLRMHRHQLKVPKVKHSLGFLYAGYRDELWWFELVDSFHKLFITSLLAFMDQDLQLDMGMVIVTLYTCIILWTNPYLRSDDDKLHLIANTEILLYLLAGKCFANPDNILDDLVDVTMTACLVLMMISFFFIFLFMALKVMKTEIQIMWAEFQKDRIAKQKEQELLKEAQGDQSFDSEMSTHTISSDDDSSIQQGPPSHLLESSHDDDKHSEDKKSSTNNEDKKSSTNNDSVDDDSVEAPRAPAKLPPLKVAEKKKKTVSSSDDDSSSDEIEIPAKKRNTIEVSSSEDSSSGDDSSSFDGVAP